ncbi:structural protein [Saccharibacter floricola]|uniref:Uncharacterized protein n=1 Tax=Saccharibacter floricola DSM 15669 TaxID=1123227 RepID=A0ABQ0P084_9PROT|nr:structural protein [Saccharibacter floricola]GBQ07274.1 hypothetical protein AA15669_1309 [Saccharibacter floricola DSM 15669]
MAMVTDSFVITLGLDGSALAKGTKQSQEGLEKLKEGTQNTGESLKKTGKDGADAFAAFRREAVGALALFTGGKSLMGFTKDITEANTALGNLSNQLDIAPQKLTQLHYAAKSVHVNPGDVDSFFVTLQNKYADGKTRAEVNNLSQMLGVDLLKSDGHVRDDALDQIARSKVYQSQSRAVKDDTIQRLGGPASLNNLLTRNDYDAIKKTFENMGPTRAQFEQSQQIYRDWTELQANTDKVMQQVYSDIDPSIHNFIQSLIAIEKAHPDEIAGGIKDVAEALAVISALLTARGFLSSLKTIAGVSVKGGGAGAAKAAGRLGVAGAAAWSTDTFFQSGISHKITNSIAEGEEYAKKTWGLNKTLNDLLQRDVDRRHELIKGDGGLLSTASVAIEEWADILGTSKDALLGHSTPSSPAPPSPTQNNTPPAKAAAGMARGERNNNPGNLRFARQDGARPEDPAHPKQGFAVFNTPEEGLSALKRQLTLYNTRDHLDTVEAIINKYAPRSDQNQTDSYIQTASQRLGVKKDQHLGTLSPRVMATLMHAIIGVENGHDRYGALVDRIAAQTPNNRATSRTSSSAQQRRNDHAPERSPLTLPPSFLSSFTKAEEERQNKHEQMVSRLTNATRAATAASTTTHNTTHHTTTNAPVVNVTVHGGNGSPDDIGQAVSSHISQALTDTDFSATM